MSKNVSRREFIRVSVAATAGAVAVACQPQTVVVEKEKVVTQVVKETVQVEKEVTKIVEKQVTVQTVKEVQVTPVPTPSGYRESPLLAERVKAGELARVEQRLPKDPLVHPVRPEVGETIGRYGGMLSGLESTPSVHSASDEGAMFQREGLATWDLVERMYVPNAADWWKLSDDYRVVTMHLRQGLRWSDGEYLTTDDVLFWWEDLILNESLTAQVPLQYAPQGEPMTLVIEDDYTFRFEYPEPYAAAVDNMTIGPFAPKHHLKNWHIKYNADADKLAKDEGYGDWWEAFLGHWEGQLEPTLRDLPVLSRWIQKEIDANGTRLFERNPYYWKVDPEGNQLPYVDRYQRVLVGSKEILAAKSVAGEYNFGGGWVPLEHYPILKENAEKAGNEIYLYRPLGGTWGSSISWSFNYCSKDLVLREIFNDLRFRKAISYSCDRNEYNQIYNLGLAIPRQGLPTPDWSFYEEGMDQYYIEYDPDLANELLDEMGLEWDKDHEYRLRPDGERLSLFTLDPGGSMRQGMELLVKYWKNVGIEFTTKPAGQELFREQLLAEELDVGTWGAGGPNEVGAHGNRPIRLIPPWHWPGCCALGGLSWWYWWESDGERGIEPPEEVKELLETWELWVQEPLGTERYIELGKKIVQINAENLWWYILTGMAPAVGNNPTATTVGIEVQNMRIPDANAGGWIAELLWIDESLVPKNRGG